MSAPPALPGLAREYFEGGEVGRLVSFPCIIVMVHRLKHLEAEDER